MDTPTPAAPAPSAPVEPTVSASIDAANRGDFDAFDRAELATRDGKPLAAVPQAPVETDPATDGLAKSGDGRTISARQQKTNDAIRAAVERADAASAARIADLERQLTTRAPLAPRAESVAAPVVPAKAASWQDVIKRPDVAQPMLTEEAFFQQFPDAPYAAYGRYWSGYDTVKDTVETRARAVQAERTTFLHERSTSLGDTLKAAQAADPDFIAKIPPVLLDPAKSVPLSFLQPGAKATFANVVAEAMLHAENGAVLAMHLHAHPDDAARIVGLPEDQWLAALARLDGRLAGHAAPLASPAAPAPPAAVARSPITAAPPPPPTLRAAGSSSDPKESARTRGDFAEYDRLEMQEQMAKRAGR